MSDRPDARRRRATNLLRLGSGVEGEEMARPGFEARLRARIAAGSPGPAVPSWTASLGLIARPALGMAALVIVTAAAVQLWDRSRPADLSALAYDDDALGALLDGNLDDFLEEDLP